MSVSYRTAVSLLYDAASSLFEADPRAQAVGVGTHDIGYGFRVVRNVRKILPASATIRALEQVGNVPVTYVDAYNDARSLVEVPFQGPGSPGESSYVLEQTRHRHLVCGLQVQNFDSDDRKGLLQKGIISVGTLGCFVQLPGGDVCMLSNNHVIAGENNGVNGSDRILQPGSGVYQANDDAAILYDQVQLQYSPPGAKFNTAALNEIDAAIAALNQGMQCVQGYLPFRNLTAPSGTLTPQIGDKVFKVGRTTGLTYGKITQYPVVVKEVGYNGGFCWFRNSLEIEGVDGTMFSDQGDSGSAIVKETGEVVGLLYAGNGSFTYACPIDSVLNGLNCSLA